MFHHNRKLSCLHLPRHLLFHYAHVQKTLCYDIHLHDFLLHYDRMPNLLDDETEKVFVAPGG